MTSKLIGVAAVLLSLILGASAHAARIDQLKKVPGAKPRYFKGLTARRAVNSVKPENSKTVDVSEKIALGNAKLAKVAPASKGTAIRKSTKARSKIANARSLRKGGEIRELRVVKIDAKSLRADATRYKSRALPKLGGR